MVLRPDHHEAIYWLSRRVRWIVSRVLKFNIENGQRFTNKLYGGAEAHVISIF